MNHQSPGLSIVQIVGTSIGSISGLAKAGVLKIKLSIMAITAVTSDPFADTIILTVTGATVGFITTKLLEYVWKKIKEKLK